MQKIFLEWGMKHFGILRDVWGRWGVGGVWGVKAKSLEVRDFLKAFIRNQIKVN